MTTTPHRPTLLVIPPPGPLAWLFPEFLRLGRQDDRLGGDATTLDLGRSWRCGATLREEIVARAPARVTLPDGPRGHTLWGWLASALHGTAIEVERPSLAPGSRPSADPGEPDDRTLESILSAGARVAPSGGGGGMPPEAAPGVRPLGFAPGPDLEPRLRAWVRTIEADPSRYRDEGVIPYFVTRIEGRESAGPAPSDVATRLLPSWWGILAGDVSPAPARTLFREMIRLLFPERAFLHRSLENYALAGIDLYLEGIAGRFASETAAAESVKVARGAGRGARGHPAILAVCGTDGSGKSSHVASLEAHLRGLGLRVRVHKIYRHGVFHETVTDLTRRCAGGRNLHLWRIQRLAKAFDSVKYFHACVEADLTACDVLLFDRYTPTHLAAGAGRYHHDPFVREILSVLPAADRVYLLDLPPEAALARIGSRAERTVDENPYMLARYRHVLLAQARRRGFPVLDACRPFEENRARILGDAERWLRAEGRLR